MGDGFPISGNIDAAAFPFLLVSLYQQGATGSLKVEGPSYQKALYFRGGRILFGSSNDPRDQLGAILIESGRITPEQLEEVNAKVGPGNPLAKVLADSGFVSQRELSEAARAKVELIVADVMAYASGTFEFEDGVLPKGAIDLKLNSEKLFLAAARRVAERGFVLRHLGGLDVVLAPRADPERIEELRPDCAGLLELLDGQRTLKEAVAQTRLDEFEGGKLACGLLFLGIVGRNERTEFLPADDGIDLDLAQAAQAVFQPESAAPGEPEPFFLPMDPPAPPPQKAPAVPEFVLPPPPTPAPAAPPAAAPPATRTEAPSAPPIGAPPPLVPPPPKPASGTSGTGSHPKLPLVPPPPRKPPARPKPPEPEPELALPKPVSPPPSREELAAVDALLNSRGIEAPLSGSTRPTPRPPAWEPRFGQQARAGRGGSRPTVGVIGAVAVLLAMAGGAAWYLWVRVPPSGPGRPSGRPTAAASASPRATPSVAPTPAASPTAEAQASPAPTAPPPSPAATPRATTPSSLAEARAALQRGAVGEASRGFEAVLRRAPRGSQTVQILVACSDETITKALQAVPSEELFVVPVNFKGRSCQRLCWGLYDGSGRAQAALGALPVYFREHGATPKVVATADILP